MVSFLKGEHLELIHEKLWVKAGGVRESIPQIWDPIPLMEVASEGSEALSEWEAPRSKLRLPRPCDWRKVEFNKWKHLVAQGHGIENFENDKISNDWLMHYRGIPHRKLITALQLRANVYPTREFLARGRHDVCVRSCRHCGAEYESASHVMGKCPITQDARIKRHHFICETLSREAKRENWTVFQEPHLRDEENELFKPDLIFVKDAKALVVDVTVRYEHSNSSLKEAAVEKAKKYQHLLPQICDLTNVTSVEFTGFPLGARGKWYERNSELLEALGLSKTRLGRLAWALASRALFSSVDIGHMFASKARLFVPLQ